MLQANKQSPGASCPEAIAPLNMSSCCLARKKKTRKKLRPQWRPPQHKEVQLHNNVNRMQREDLHQPPAERNQETETRGEGPGARLQEPETREQPPKTRVQGSGNREQPTGAKNLKPGTKDQGPGIREQRPGARARY